jgi:hypothetical protein
MEKYCPECRTVCGEGTCRVDKQGHCERCGKPPVDYADRDRPWLWCETHQVWHSSACKDDAVKRCCEPAAA